MPVRHLSEAAAGLAAGLAEATRRGLIAWRRHYSGAWSHHLLNGIVTVTEVADCVRFTVTDPHSLPVEDAMLVPGDRHYDTLVALLAAATPAPSVVHAMAAEVAAVLKAVPSDEECA